MTDIAPSSASDKDKPTPRALRGKWGVLGILLIVCLFFNLLWTIFHWGGPERLVPISDLFSLPPSVLVFLIACRVAVETSLSREIRRAWLILAFSSLAILLGNLAWWYLEVVKHVAPFPSLADVFFLAFYPLGLGGLLSLPSASQSPRERLTLCWDLLSVLLAAAMFVSYFIIIPSAAGETDLLTRLFAPIYPIGSLFLTGGIFALLYRRPSPEVASGLNLLLVGMLFFVGADFGFGYTSLLGTYTAGGWTDLCWNIAHLFFGLAALRQLIALPASRQPQAWTRFWNKCARWLPLLALALAYGLVFYTLILDDERGAEWLMAGTLFLSLLVVGRQIVSPAFVDLPIRVKVFLTFMMVSVFSVCLVSATAYLTIHAQLQELAGYDLRVDGEIRAQTLGNELSKQLEMLESFALGEIFEQDLRAANASYSDEPAKIDRQIQEREQAWSAASDSDPLIRKVLENPAANELSDFRRNVANHSDVLLTDRYGAVIAATHRPKHYSQASEEWWRSVSASGASRAFIGPPTFNPETQSFQVLMAIPVRAGNTQEVIGVLRTTVDIQSILDMLIPRHARTEMGFNLLLPDGRLLDSEGEEERLDPRTMKKLQASEGAGYVLIKFDGILHTLSQAPLVSSNQENSQILQDLDWKLIAHQEPATTFAPLRAAWRSALFATLIVLFLTSIVAVVLAHILIAPIIRLTGRVARLADGDFTTKAFVESRDEIGTLAHTFNNMLKVLSHTRKELQESEALYRSLVDYSPDVILVYRDGKLLFVNPAGVELLGATHAQVLLGRTILDLIPLEERARVQASIELTQATNQPTPLLHQVMYRLDGTSFEAEFRAIPILYAGEPAIQLVLRDITQRNLTEQKIAHLLSEVERQKSELELRVEQRTAELSTLNHRLQQELAERQRLVQSLRDHERQLAQAAALAKIAYWELDLQTSNFIFNDQLYTLLRTSAEQSGGYLVPAERFLNEFVHHEDVDHIRELIQAAQTSSSSHGQLEFRCLCGDGQVQYSYLEYQIVFDSPGHSSRVFGAYMDVTERQRLIHSLRESEEHFRLLFEASPDAILLIDPDDALTSGTIMDCNQAACRMNGFTREELMGQPIDLINAYPQQASEREEYTRMIHEKGILHYEALHRKKSGDIFPVDVSTSIIRFGGRELILGIDRDITERKQAELALQAAKEEAERSRRTAEAASRSKSEFLSRMSHELRTPMNAILGFAQLLEMSRKEPLTSSQKERIKQIVKGGQHLLELINEILDISRIEANRLHISPEPVSVRASIQEALDLSVPLAVKRQIQIVTRLGRMEENLFVLADRQRLKQILINLLGNAVKYNYDGGSVIISCAEAAGAHLRISVSDTGPGISRENQARLFIPFERLGENQPNVEGTGLGLVLAKRLVELMHGRIGAESMVGRGSTFWIELPLAESPLEQLGRTGPTGGLPSLSTGTQTILYVEDNVANFELIQQVLADYSQIKLLWATDVRTGLELIHQQQPDVILLDLHLGMSDGAELLQELKRHRETVEIPVVVISADATAGQIERLKAEGAYAYLTKPLDVKQFMRLIEELLGEKEF